MSEFFDILKLKTNPKTPEEYTVSGGIVRVSVLSDRLIRIEKSEGGEFCDKATQCVINRNFASPEFESEINGRKIIIKTAHNEFCVDTATAVLDYVIIDGKKRTEYVSGNLKGTKRTLDQSFGRVALGEGILSKNGVATFNDGKSLMIEEDGTVQKKNPDSSDIYYFAHGRNYREALFDYYSLTGFPPLIPRFAFGNWWSRYKAYTQQEYLDLMARFKKEDIPLTVATIDMDWHWVDVAKPFGPRAAKREDPKGIRDFFNNIVYNAGWTGYTWNTDLFPNPQEFLDTLKRQNLRITVNLHPAQGVRWFEDAYKEFAEFMGMDPKLEKTIEFDITDKKFIEGYFRFLHEPMEKAGVDFWWIDWQQGSKSKIEGLDPLWALNHYHFLYSGRNPEHRPLILSRFAGVGSQRYPLGFSGDTAQNWEVLKFQPYFTSTASNIGYSWWSHDIGGHHFGKKDDELYLRWVQYGIFSPIMRLHSTSNEFMGKEPWNYSCEVEANAKKQLRLRHRLIPYIYSQNYLAHTKGKALCEPMYYEYPDNESSYGCPNEFFFGSELIVAPITEPVNPNTRLAGTYVWFPNGRYTDVFTGRIYEGERELYVFRDIGCIPVFAKEGAIIPMYKEDVRDIKNPDSLDVMLYRGNGAYSLYEDDGETDGFENGKYSITDFALKEDADKLTLTIENNSKDISTLPEKRSYTLYFRDIVRADCEIYVNGEIKECKASDCCDCVAVETGKFGVRDKIKVVLKNTEVLTNTDKRSLLINTISKYQGSNEKKKPLYTDYVNGKKPMPKRLRDEFRMPLEEIEALKY